MVVFLDTTALAALFLDSPEGEDMRLRLRSEGDGAAIATVTTVEFTAFLRDLSEEAVEPSAVQTIAASFLGALGDLLVVAPDMELASLLVVRHRLEPGQAQVLSAAMSLRDRIKRNTALVPDPVLFATLDPDLLEAARLEDLHVVP